MNIKEQVFLITGATDGMGKLAAMDIAKLGATVLIHGRSKEKCMTTKDEIIASTGNNKIQFYLGDFSSLEQVRCLADEILADYTALDVLINNAGIGFGDLNDKTRALSEDGFELRLAVNYLAPFLLTCKLLPLLMRKHSRVVNVASIGQSSFDLSNIMLEKDYSPTRAYMQSKLALVAFTFELSERYGNTGTTFNCLHPGSYLNTKMVCESGITPLGSVQSGSDAIEYLAFSPELEGVTGKYFDQKKESRAESQTYDIEFRRKLWDLSERLTANKSFQK
ncbi:SDR family NAD(P)-dependent oxidoreductase [Clostridium sp. BL-8]|uniref:SDR family NAD(P)-dependent oxidoreductase n=1 Tax=Clostridium sp. BL-8 TaxID=349938 RepID=UPI00098BDBD0|nr:SDR family NAD(P)-dependent oxidoreductase [Clostridium sp. BL-8]OOM78090.1 fatty acyl-CoA reductase [Clostridium sp. BL-8]